MFAPIIVAMLLNGEIVKLTPTDRFDTEAECMAETAMFAAAFNYEMSVQGEPAAAMIVTCEKGADA